MPFVTMIREVFQNGFLFTLSFRRALNFLSSSTVCNESYKVTPTWYMDWRIVIIRSRDKKQSSQTWVAVNVNDHLVEVNFGGVSLPLSYPPKQNWYPVGNTSGYYQWVQPVGTTHLNKQKWGTTPNEATWYLLYLPRIEIMTLHRMIWSLKNAS